MPIRYRQRSFELSFDFQEHRLLLESSDGLVQTLPLVSRSVAEFYQEFMDMLWSEDIAVRIWKRPVEVPNPIPFDQDRVHAAYDPEYAQRFWRILLTVHDVFGDFRSRFIGKCSPVHFFWGSFDLAVTRFSGRPAPERPGTDAITCEAYSHEVSSVGFGPGGGHVRGAAFYSYTAPEPQGLRQAAVRPDATFYDAQLANHRAAGFLPEHVRRCGNPRRLGPPSVGEAVRSGHKTGLTEKCHGSEMHPSSTDQD